jgi:glucuronosyltransferase
MKDFFVSTATYDNPIHKINLLQELGLASCRHAFQTENVRNFVHAQNLTFDLVIAEQFVQESFLMFAHKYHSSLIAISMHN